jgi:F1F0 ATPase subunit 2
MSEIIFLILAFIAGMLLGIIFFGGLWLTVKKCVKVKYFGLLFGLSFFLRIGIALSGFYFVFSDSWTRLLICIMGFTISRFIISKWVEYNKNPVKKRKEMVRET